MDFMFARSRISLALTSLLTLAYSCGQDSSSSIQEAWDSTNNPAKMSLGSNDYEMQFDKLPASGNLTKTPWTSTYWPTYVGGVSQRWFNGEDGNQNVSLAEKAGYELLTKERIAALSLEEKKLLSPSEKLDILRGNYDFPLTLSERSRTRVLRTIVGNPNYEAGFEIASWEGLCHGWAPAAINFEEPKPVTVTNSDNIEIPFGSADIKALLTYLEHAKRTRTNFLAGRCELDLSGERYLEQIQDDFIERLNQLSEQFQAGKITQEVYNTEVAAAQKARTERVEEVRKWIKSQMDSDDCRDTNPGSFHVVIANQIALRNEGFVVDVTRDYQVWNQPVNGFSSQVLETYEGKDAITQALGAEYMEQAARGTAKVVRVETLMNYIVELPTTWDAIEYPMGENIETVEYNYYLELDANNQIIGGKWIDGLNAEKDRPDFMWKKERPEFSGEFSELGRIYELATKPGQ